MSSVKIFNTVDASKERLISLIAIIKVFTLRQPPSGLACFLTIPLEDPKLSCRDIFNPSFVVFFPPREATLRQNLMQS